MGLARLLRDHRLYLAEIDRLHLKLYSRHSLYSVHQDGVPFSMVSLDRIGFAKRLADTVAAGDYRLQPARLRRMRVKKKERVFYEFRVTDRIVHGALSSLLTRLYDREREPCVYSYTKGVSWWDAILDFSRFVRKHRRQRPDTSTRGLYVIRRDVRNYADSIPLRDSSRLWPMLHALLATRCRGGRVPAAYWSLFQDVVRPVAEIDGRPASPLAGVPTGSPVATVVFNLYLRPLDDAMSSIPGGFYARYSDDFLFAHPDVDVTRRANDRMTEIIDSLDLATHPAKDRKLFFNGAARRSDAWPAASGAASVPFLGCDVGFDATVRLGRKKTRDLLHVIETRARRTSKLLADRPLDQVGPVVCCAVNAAIDPQTPVHHGSATLLRKGITDRRQLRELDYRIARLVASILSGVSGPRAFRHVPYRTLRNDWRLVSLLHGRNLEGKGRRKASCAS